MEHGVFNFQPIQKIKDVQREKEEEEKEEGGGQERMIKQLWQNVESLNQVHTGVLYTKLATFCNFKIIPK